MSTTSGGTTLGTMAESITGSFTNVSKLITAGSYVAGLGFSIGAIMKFKQHKDNPTQIPIGTPAALTAVAASLLFLPTVLSAKGTDITGSAISSGDVSAASVKAAAEKAGISASSVENAAEKAAEKAGVLSTGLTATAEPLETTEIDT